MVVVSNIIVGQSYLHMADSHAHYGSILLMTRYYEALVPVLVEPMVLEQVYLAKY